MLVTVAETPEYLRRAEKLLSAADRAAIAVFLAGRPRAGDVMQGTGGVRKLRCIC